MGIKGGWETSLEVGSQESESRKTEWQVASQRGSSIFGFLPFHGTIGHAETRAEMFRQQHDSILILLGILLRQVSHGLHQHTLALNIAGIGRSPSADGTAVRIGN